MNKFFTAVFSIRYLTVVAVVGPFLGAALMLLFGAINVIQSYMIFLMHSRGLSRYEKLCDHW